MSNRYIIGAQVLGHRQSVGSDLERWEKIAIGTTALASVATLIEITYQWVKRRKKR